MVRPRFLRRVTGVMTMFDTTIRLVTKPFPHGYRLIARQNCCTRRANKHACEALALYDGAALE